MADILDLAKRVSLVAGELTIRGKMSLIQLSRNAGGAPQHF